MLIPFCNILLYIILIPGKSLMFEEFIQSGNDQSYLEQHLSSLVTSQNLWRWYINRNFYCFENSLIKNLKFYIA